MRFREFEERLVVALQRFGREGIERVTQPLFGVVEQRQFFLSSRSLRLQTCLGSGTAFGLAFQLGKALYVAFSFRSVDRRLKLLPRKKREGPSPNDDSR